ncbi:hypothetical protein Celaphus_00008851, partial [Cervus elaphus hippelaphus]
MPALVRRSLPARLTVPPTPSEGFRVLKPSCLGSHPPHQPVPALSAVTPLPEHPAQLDPFPSVQQSVPQTIALSNLPQAFVGHPPVSVLSNPPPCNSPSSSLSSPSNSISSSSSSLQLSSSSSVLSSSPSPSPTTSPFLPLLSIPLFSSPLYSSPSPYLPSANLDFPSPIPSVSSSFMISSSFPPMLHSSCLSASPSSFIPIHSFNPPHWGKKVEKRREASGVEKKEIEKKKLRDDNLKAIDNDLPSSLSKNDHKHQKYLISKISCGQEMENSKANLTTNKDAFQLKLEETQKLLEDQHLSSLQKFRDEVNQIINSETLSSIDSLEAGEREEIYLTLNKEPSTSVQQQNSISLKSANLQSANLSCFDEDKLSFSKTQHINNWLVNIDDPNIFSDIFSKPNVLPDSSKCFNSKEQNPSTLSRTVERAINTANNSVAILYSPSIFVQDKKSKNTSETSVIRTTDSSEAFKRERPLVSESPKFKFSKAWATPDSLTQEITIISDQEKYSEMTQENRTTSVPTSFVPLATPLVLPLNTQSARPLPKSSIHIKEIDPVQCSDKLGEMKDIKDEKTKYFNCNEEELSLFSDNFQATYILHNSDSKDEKQEISEAPKSLSNIISNCDLVNQHKKMKYNICEKNSVRFLKSILKKESKYEHDYFKALVTNQGFKLGNQKAAVIRDSIELTKERGKSAETPKTIKKLRWFDETGNTRKNAEDSHLLKSRKRVSQQWSQPFHIRSKSGAASNMPSIPASAVDSANKKEPKDDFISENVTALGGSGIDHVPLNCCIPSDYSTAKQAWPDSTEEETISPAKSGGSKTQKTNPQRSEAKVVRRTRSAKVQSGFVCMNRKGTVIRPQSASKASTFLQAQGKLIVPHPPPPSQLNIRSCKNMQVSQCQSVMPENSQNISTCNYFNSKHMLPTEHKLNQWNQESSLPLPHVCSDLDTVMPALPYCSSECQTLTKINHSNGSQTVAPQDGMLYCPQRCPTYEESHPSVTLKTTREELVPMWKRQHNILGQNEKAA